MIVRENPDAVMELLRLAQEHRAETKPRAPGLHASDLIYCRRKAWYRRQSGAPEEVLDEETLCLFLMGQGHHNVFERCAPEKEVVLELEGIVVICTPDIECPDDVKFPGELKTTRMTANKNPVYDAAHYIEQLCTYCLARNVRSGRLYVFYLNGTYARGKGGMRPKMVAYDITFTPEEMGEWRRELTFRALQVTGETVPTGKSTHKKWECGYCPLNMAKGGPCSAPEGTDPKDLFFHQDNPPEWVV